MLVRKSRFDALESNYNDMTRLVNDARDERDRAEARHKQLDALLDTEIKENENLRDAINRIQTDADRIQKQLDDTLAELEETRVSYGDVEVEGVLLQSEDNGVGLHKHARTVSYDPDSKYAELFDGAGRLLSGHQNITGWRYIYRPSED